MPHIPLGVELLFSAGTALLLHFGAVDPAGLKPSYLVFLNKLTGARFDLPSTPYHRLVVILTLIRILYSRFAALNRHLFQHEFGGNAAALQTQFPNYDYNIIGDKLKTLIPIIRPGIK